MKNKIKNLGIAVLSVGALLASGTAADARDYTNEKTESRGIEQKVEKEYGRAVKIRVIDISGKDHDRIVDDTSREITFEDGTIVTYHHGQGREKTVERMAGGKRITERFENPRSGPGKDTWEIHERTVEYEKGGASIREDYWLNSFNTGIELRYVTVEKPANDGKIVEQYQRNDYFEGKKPWDVTIITEKAIYPKGTDNSKSMEYFESQNEGLDGKEFFEKSFYRQIERKCIEEKTPSGAVTRRKFETLLTEFGGRTEKRIEQDYKLFERPICDGKIDYRRSTKEMPGGTYDRIDYNGDGIADEEITRKITTIYLD